MKEHKAALGEKDIVWLGHLKRVFTLLDSLREVGCERDRAGNRQLHFDDYVKLVLLYVWNPAIQRRQLLGIGAFVRSRATQADHC